MHFQLGSSWTPILSEEIEKPYISSLAAFVEMERYSGFEIFPSRELVFNAFYLTPYEKVKVVIVGQDPYHGKGQAHGLSFSVPKGIPFPPSLQNIFKELTTDLNKPIPAHGCLTAWAEQGVLLMNATLTVREGKPMSHHGKGWERFTDSVILKLAERMDPVIFVLWGKSAQEKCKHLIGNNRHFVLTAPHPSPFSAYSGFFGCRHFSKINDLLIKSNNSVINW